MIEERTWKTAEKVYTLARLENDVELAVDGRPVWTDCPEAFIELGRQAGALLAGRPLKAGMRWSPEDDARLQEEFRAGRSAEELASSLERSRMAVRARLVHHGLLDDPTGRWRAYVPRGRDPVETEPAVAASAL